MIVYKNGKVPEKELEEMDRGDLLSLDYELLTEEEKEAWNNRFDEAPDFIIL